MASATDFLRVFEWGETTVVGFVGPVLPDQLDLDSIRQDLGAMLRQNGSSAIAFNLSGVAFLPSAILGLLAALTRDGFQVHLHTPSANLRSVLEVTHLNRLFTVHELGV
jgi:anti-anti-sigma regulatory factor